MRNRVVTCTTYIVMVSSMSCAVFILAETKWGVGAATLLVLATSAVILGILLGVNRDRLW